MNRIGKYQVSTHTHEISWESEHIVHLQWFLLSVSVLTGAKYAKKRSRLNKTPIKCTFFLWLYAGTTISHKLYNEMNEYVVA